MTFWMHPVFRILLLTVLMLTGLAASAATYQYNDNAPYNWETASTDVVWSRSNTRYPVDDDHSTVSLGFNFPFAGTNYSRVRILSNGILQFGGSSNLHRYYENATLPHSEGSNAIFVYWDDLNPGRGGTVRYSMHGTAPHRYFVVSWDDLPNYNYTGVYNLQVILYEDGEFKLQYGNGNATGDSATIGVQVGTRDYTEYSFNRTGAVDADTAIVFYQDRPHFALGVQSSADLCRSNAVNVSVTRHTTGHAVDTSYTGTITLTSTATGGTWSNVSGVGRFTDLGSGRASYTFAAGDRGQALLQFGYPDPAITGFHVNDGSAFEHHAEDPYLTFQYGVTDNAADDFGTGDYVGNSGSLNWSTDWVEINEYDGSGSGDIRITSGVLQLQDNDGGGEGVYREVDLSGNPGGTQAVLTFKYRRSGLDSSNDYVAVNVSSNGGRSWRELDRFTGPGSDSGYQTAGSDSAAEVAASTRISFLTSRWMGSSDRVYIDDVDIGLRTPTCGIDHYGISHGGVGVTCEASSVRVSAHDSGHGTAEPGAGVEVTVTATDVASGITASDASWAYTGSGSFADLGSGRARYTFADSETDVELWLSRPAGGLVNIDALDNNGAVEHSTEDPDLEFRDSALRIYADGVADAVGSQIAGKSSATAPGAQRLTIRAIETNTDTGVCEARLTGRQPVEFGYECIAPASCALGRGASVDGTAIPGNAAGSVSSFQSVTLSFDASGVASIPFQYDDAGSLVLHAQAVLPASAAQPAITVSGASNSFVVAPAGLCVEATSADADCASGDASCSVMGRAGAAFDIAVRGVAWQASGESDTDFCSGNATTRNFHLASIPLSAQLVAPAGGVNGNLRVTSMNIDAADNGSATRSQAYSEVGAFRITATPPTYQGVSIAASQSANIGRQVPDHFALTGNLLGAGCGSFTYMDQPALGIDYTVEARNASSVRTQNYRDAFARGDVDMVAEDANDGVDLGTRVSGPSGSWNAGAQSVSTANAIFTRSPAPDGPFDSLSIGLTVDDNDGSRSLLQNPDMKASDNGDCVANGDCDAVSLGTTRVRYGRLNLVNAHGSELLGLAVPLRTETYQGSSLGFGVSGDDNCSALGGVQISEVDASDGLLPGETCAWDDVNASGVGCAGVGPPAAQFSATATAGLFNLNLRAPGSGNTGVVSLGADGPDWLEFDWNGAGDQDPAARATFGIFNRRSGVIYQREVR